MKKGAEASSVSSFHNFRPWWNLGGTSDSGFVYAMAKKARPQEPVLLDAAEASEDESKPLYSAPDSYRVSMTIADIHV